MAGRPATLKVDIIGDNRDLKRATADSEGRLSRFGKAAGTFGKVAALGVAAVGVAAVGVAREVVKSASEQQQAYGALDSIYGKNAKTVKAWAASAAQDVGLTKTEYGNLSAIVGSQLKNMGRSQQEAAGDSNDLIKMGADLAATFGGSVSDAVGAVSSLLKGERDPIERYGVSIKQADINARLAALGQDKLTGSAMATAQANATLYLLTKQTASAHGAFAKESNTLAGQQERLSAQFENTKATVGAKLLPVLTQVTTFANAKLFPAMGKGAATLSTKLGPAFAAVGRFITGTAVPAFQRIAGFISGTVVPIIRSYLTPYLAGVRSAFANVAAAVQRNRPQLDSLVGGIKNVVVWLAEHLAPILGTIIGTGFKVLGTVLSGVIDGIGGFVEGIKSAVTWVQNLWDKLDRLASKVTSIHLPDLNPFSAVGVMGMVAPALVGAGPDLAPGGGRLATAALGDLLAGGFTRSSASSASTGAAVVRVDARTYVTIDGALDAPAVARQLEQILRDQAVRLGRVSSYAPGRA